MDDTWQEIKNDFLKRWPLEKVKKMTLEEYTNLNKDNSFTYWLESKTTDVIGIGGGSSYKFGVFKRNPKAIEKALRSGQKSDGEYGWYSKYGNNKNDAFKNIKKLIIQVIESAQHSNFNDIDNIDLGNAIKWKIAFMYADAQTLLRFASDKAFYFLANKYNIDEKDISVIQRKLIAMKPNDEPFYEFSSRLWVEFFESDSNEQEFRKWLKDSKKLADSTINKYISRLIKSIPKKLHDQNSLLDVKTLIGIDERRLRQVYSMLQMSGSMYDWNISTQVKSEASAAVGNYLEYMENLNSQEDYEIIEDHKPMVKFTNHLNQILCGPPGTGKTYQTINEALGIIYQCSSENLEQVIANDIQLDDRVKSIDNVRERFKKTFEYYKQQGQIEFVTFHQNYGYEEFVEGIKALPPGRDGNEDGDEMIYDIVPGIFKRLCFEAQKKTYITGDIEFNTNAKVWKISLGGSGSIHQVKKDCFDKNQIRIGWPQITNLDDEKFKQLGSKNKNTIKNFFEKMEIGDIVLSLGSQKTIDAIGVITSDCQRDKYENFPHFREVTWLQKDINFNIFEMNGKRNLTLQTVYQLNRIRPDMLSDFFKDSTDEIYEDNSKKNYILIIDEINRGNISKIFGELITLIEDSKRIGKPEELRATLPYSGIREEPFGVPSNLYIIGTMNTADRSITSIDTALRRRFLFIEILPKPELLGNHQIQGINIQKMLEAINARIEYLYDRDHMIGHAYFMSLFENNQDDEGNEIEKTPEEQYRELFFIMKNKIIPLLAEYFYEDWENIRLIFNDNNFIQNKNDDNKYLSKVNNSVRGKKIYAINPLFEVDTFEIQQNLIDNFCMIYDDNVQKGE
ncbi:MAG: AAA family ATPase [Sulfuricurvum sp.]|uniref:AAA family ATPase n=1 Tax=Sulfuricurvum sp. TaxID=2025608 RepID=UPI002621654D|nr:AAA family ATPase [Sulfuricurvum sp.]MDD2829238.1 AAA family ATPase [Sulfuricurvum sp.]